eukprot:15432840-Alexandrium_andersonii.AAC.1
MLGLLNVASGGARFGIVGWALCCARACAPCWEAEPAHVERVTAEAEESNKDPLHPKAQWPSWQCQQHEPADEQQGGQQPQLLDSPEPPADEQEHAPQQQQQQQQQPQPQQQKPADEDERKLSEQQQQQQPQWPAASKGPADEHAPQQQQQQQQQPQPQQQKPADEDERKLSEQQQHQQQQPQWPAASSQGVDCAKGEPFKGSGGGKSKGKGWKGKGWKGKGPKGKGWKGKGCKGKFKESEDPIVLSSQDTNPEDAAGLVEAEGQE